MAAIAAMALLATTSVQASAAGSGKLRVVANAAALSDLSTATADPTDGARAGAIALSRDGKGTLVLFTLYGLDPASAGMTYGAHVHTGPCVAGIGAAAGPHYNSTGGVTINSTTEVWLDFTVRTSTTAGAMAKVPFVIPAGGAGSIVVHAMPTAPAGTAGPRLACLPLQF